MAKNFRPSPETVYSKIAAKFGDLTNWGGGWRGLDVQEAFEEYISGYLCMRTPPQLTGGSYARRGFLCQEGGF